jgi:hypothetical protein
LGGRSATPLTPDEIADLKPGEVNGHDNQEVGDGWASSKRDFHFH